MEECIPCCFFELSDTPSPRGDGWVPWLFWYPPKSGFSIVFLCSFLDTFSPPLGGRPQILASGWVSTRPSRGLNEFGFFGYDFSERLFLKFELRGAFDSASEVHGVIFMSIRRWFNPPVMF